MTQTETDRQVLVFVYGTLKSGGRLNGGMISAGGTICGEAKILTKDYIMRSLGGYPALQKVASGSGTYIHGELWVVPATGVAVLDRIEGYPDFYSRDMITVWSGDTSFKAIAYYIDTTGDEYNSAMMAQRPVVESGEWDALANCPKPTGQEETTEMSDREDCSECGYWLLPTEDADTMECNNCGASVTTVPYTDESVPWENEEDPVFSNSDFVVEGKAWYILNESGDAYGPYDSINAAAVKIQDVANEYGEEVRSLYIGFRLLNRHLSNDELADLETDTDFI